jgi:hypothetical protein
MPIDQILEDVQKLTSEDKQRLLDALKDQTDKLTLTPEQKNAINEHVTETILSDKGFDEKFRQMMTWAAVASIGVASLCTFLFVAFETFWGKTAPENWCITLVQNHYAAIFGTPSAVAAAFLIVALFKATSGNIEFAVWGFKFKGASGPIVLWILCFLAIAFAFYNLWQRGPEVVPLLLKPK